MDGLLSVLINQRKEMQRGQIRKNKKQTSQKNHECKAMLHFFSSLGDNPEAFYLLCAH